jgi:GT2 family glycosyltransferase
MPCSPCNRWVPLPDHGRYRGQDDEDVTTRPPAEFAARLEQLERDVEALTALVSRRNAEVEHLAQSQEKTAKRLAVVAGRANRAVRWPAQPPRILRVLRKRLKMLGLWRGHANEATTGRAASPLISARLLAPAGLKDAFDRLSPFEAWQAVNSFTPAAAADLAGALKATPGLPRISVITPVYNTPPAYLQAMAESVLGQVFTDWELCFADDASSSPETIAALDRIARTDGRVRVTRLAANGGISEATNAAVAMATGEVIVFVDHDDLITADCLAEIALYFAVHPEADLVYSDDDKIDDAGRRYAPQFKPDFAPTLLLSYMYMGHALAVRRELFLELGGFRKAFDGSQDYDFALRAVERARHVGHVPRILYHWRAAPGSTAVSGDAKPASFEAGRRAVEEALDRRGITGQVVHPDWAVEARVGMFDIRFPDTGPRVTIVIPTYNRGDLLRTCVESLARTRYADFDVLILDNGSDQPEALAYIAELVARPGYRVVRVPQRPSGFNFAALLNEGVREAGGDYVLLLNNDTEVLSPDWLGQMVGYARMDGVGSVGARLLFEDGTVQHAGIVKGYEEGLAGHAFRHAASHDWGYMGFMKASREYSAVTAACILTPRALFLEMGGFDEANFAVAYNDVDYGLRLVRAGLRNIYCAGAELYHFEGKTRGGRDNPREVLALRRLYGDQTDPFYNPNLSFETEKFDIETRRLPRRANRLVRVAAVSHNLNFEGAPNTLLDLMIGLKGAGLADPVVFAPGDGPLRVAYEAAGIEVRLFSQPHPSAGVAAFEAAVDVLGAGFSEIGAEVVVANTLPMFFAVTAARRLGLGAIWCQHESEPWGTYFDDLSPEVRSFAYAAFAQAYRVTYVARATLRAWAPVQTRHTAQLIRHGIPPKRLEAETSRWTRDAARQTLGLPAQDVVILLLGTVCRRKGQNDLIEALALMSDRVVGKMRVLIVGATPEPDFALDLKRRIGQLSQTLRDRLVITGAVDDVTAYYAAADILVCTSRIESAPRIIVEGMAFGLPIITTDVFGIPELVDKDVNAIFYTPEDHRGLALALVTLIEDAGLRARMGADSRVVLESRPGYAEMITQYGQVIAEAALLNECRDNSAARIGQTSKDVK